jgi:hypothetical protein
MMAASRHPTRRAREEGRPDAASPARGENAPPARWRGLLSADEHARSVAAIGAERLDELHSMLEQVSPAFRARFLDHLADLGPGLPAGRAVLLAVARASHDAAEHTRAARQRAGRDR